MGPTGAGRSFGYAAGSTLLTLALSEGIVRVADNGALPQLDCYVATSPIGLAPGCARTLGRPSGGVWTLEIDDEGRRVIPHVASGLPWLILGDSQVLGSTAKEIVHVVGHCSAVIVRGAIEKYELP